MKKLFQAFLTVVAVALVGFAPAVTAQNLPPTWVFARAYNYSPIVGQQANTYTWNGGVCNYSPYTGGTSPSFFVFSGTIGSTTVYNPVFIQDVNSALNEVVTPSSTTQGVSACGFAASAANQHVSFQVGSGTGGLQEAIETQLQSSPVFTVFLDKVWYASVAALPSGTPQSIIAAVTGTANVSIVDTTTAPWTAYTWNGSKYVAASSTGSIAFSSVTLVSAPTALSTAASTNGLITTGTTGGTVPASSTYRLCATYVTALGGETACSTDSASTATIATGTGSTNTLAVTSPAAATGAIGWRLYVSAASGGAGSEILYAPSCQSATGQIVLNGVCAIGSAATVTAIVTGTADVPAASSAFQVDSGTVSPLQTVAVSYPPYPVVATISAAATGTLGVINLPAGYLNTLGRHIHIHGTGFGTTNSTPGTLTVATTLASVPGVTLITPFTAVSGTTTASAVINFTFDLDITTEATGTSGTLECHGTVAYNLAGTAVSSVAQDLITAVSSSVDLTKQDQLAVTLKPTTTAITTGGAQLRQLTVQALQ